MGSENNNRTTDTTTNVEPDISDGRVAAKAAARYDSPVNISIHSYRYRLADPDGISSKAVIDSLVKGGVLANDTAKEVKEVRYSQTQVYRSQGGVEKTVITIDDGL